MEDELNFRREEEKQMQEHMENYQSINAKLKERIKELEKKVLSASNAG